MPSVNLLREKIKAGDPAQISQNPMDNITYGLLYTIEVSVITDA